MMRLFLVVVLCLSIFRPTLAFCPANNKHVVKEIRTASSGSSMELGSHSPFFENTDGEVAPSTTMTTHMMTATGLLTGLATFVNGAMAGEEIEMAELPPPWVPAVFAVVLLIGVGVLTGSLGNVIDEEASLGLQSGARARKEIERSKSSYFKKR